MKITNPGIRGNSPIMPVKIARVYLNFTWNKSKAIHDTAVLHTATYVKKLKMFMMLFSKVFPISS